MTLDKDKFKKYRYSILDYMAVKKFDISTKAVNLIAEISKSATLANPDAAVAHVADQDFIYGLARMWEALADEEKWETMVFRNKKDAKV
jgi:hypothetical protein